MIDTKNMEIALEHLENTRETLDSQLKAMTEELSEKYTELARQQTLLQEDRRCFEEQKAVILGMLNRLHQQLQGGLTNEEKEEATLQAGEASFENIPIEEWPKGDTEQEQIEQKPLLTLPKEETAIPFIELDEDESVQTEPIERKEEPEKKHTSTAPIFGMAIPVNDLASALQQQPLKDLAKGIGINDRFLFIKELFDGHANVFNEVVKKLNNLGNLAEATAYLARYGDKWDMESEAVKQFMLLVHRRYL